MSHWRIASSVLVLQTSLRNGVEKVFPDNQLEKHALIDPLLVFAVDQDLELLPLLFQLEGGSQKNAPRNHAMPSCLVRTTPYS